MEVMEVSGHKVHNAKLFLIFRWLLAMYFRSKGFAGHSQKYNTPQVITKDTPVGASRDFPAELIPFARLPLLHFWNFIRVYTASRMT